MADRRLEMWGELAAHAAARGARVSVADVCAVAAGAAQLSGAWVAVAQDAEPGFLMCATDPVGEQLAELQLMLGEGPCHDVLVSAAPVLAADLGDTESGRRWPAFTPEARERGSGAVFVFPLVVGVIRAGVMGLYRRSAGPLRDGQLGDLLILADVATMLLLDGLSDGGAAAADGVWPNGQSPDLAQHRAEIDQATGMLTLQLGVTIEEAFARLRAYAYCVNRRLTDVASDIVARRLRLQPDPVPDGAP
jgi:ANTAR domain